MIIRNLDPEGWGLRFWGFRFWGVGFEAAFSLAFLQCFNGAFVGTPSESSSLSGVVYGTHIVIESRHGMLGQGMSL